MLCSIYRSHQLITNKAQDRQGNSCILWEGLQLCNHPGQEKSLSKQIAAIRVDAISWHCFKCQQQTRHSLGIWWWRREFKWTSGRNTTAEKTIDLIWEGRLASFSMSFALFCFENMTRTMNYEFSAPFWESFGIFQTTVEWTERKKSALLTHFVCYNWLWVTFWDVRSLWICINLANYLKI